MSTIQVERGDIALVYFPHSDLITIKLRPVLTIQADALDTGIPQVIVAMISGNMTRSGHPARVTARLHDPFASGTGLRQNSVIMADNLVTVDWELIQARIGRVQDMSAVDAALKVALAL